MKARVRSEALWPGERVFNLVPRTMVGILTLPLADM